MNQNQQNPPTFDAAGHRARRTRLALWLIVGPLVLSVVIAGLVLSVLFLHLNTSIDNAVLAAMGMFVAIVGSLAVIIFPISILVGIILLITRPKLR